MSAKIPAALGLAAVAGLLVAACGSASGQVEQAPATVKPIAGSRVQQVQLSAPAIHRLGIVTQPVRVAAAGSGSGRAGSRTEIPYSAVVYDTDGSTWTYVEAMGRTFVRNRVSIAAIEGRTAILTKGPAVGAQVVTVGAPELLGTEYDISGEE
jgi:hypothetical protein